MAQRRGLAHLCQVALTAVCLPGAIGLVGCAAHRAAQGPVVAAAITSAAETSVPSESATLVAPPQPLRRAPAPSSIPLGAQPVLTADFAGGGHPQSVYAINSAPSTEHVGGTWRILITNRRGGGGAPPTALPTVTTVVGVAPWLRAMDVTGTGHPDLIVQSTFGASAPDDLQIYQDQRGHWVRIFQDAGLPKIVTLPGQPLPVLLFTHGGNAWGYRWTSGKGYVGLTAPEIRAASAQVGWSGRNPTPDRSKPEPVVPTVGG